MDRTEEIQSLLEEFIPRLNALRDDALKEIGEASETANRNVSRHARAQEELGRVEAQISSLKAERESLPVAVTRANLDEDYAREDDLRERYLSIKPAIESLEERREALRREIHALNPIGDSHPNNVTIQQYGEVAGVASSPRHELEALKEELSKAIAAAVDPVIAKHDSLRSTVWQLGHDRAWDESPVGRGALQA